MMLINYPRYGLMFCVSGICQGVGKQLSYPDGNIWGKQRWERGELVYPCKHEMCTANKRGFALPSPSSVPTHWILLISLTPTPLQYHHKMCDLSCNLLAFFFFMISNFFKHILSLSLSFPPTLFSFVHLFLFYLALFHHLPLFYLIFFILKLSLSLTY